MIQSVPYDQISGYSKLFLDYVNDYDRVQEFFNGKSGDNSTWTDQIKRCRQRDYNRDELINILFKQNKSATLKKAVVKQIEKLRNPDSVAIVTGQQAGLFWGPLYTVYKALTTVKMAATIEKQYKVPVVPVFWLEVDDHDFDEVRQFTLMLPSGEVRKFEYDDGESEKAVPVNNRIITDNISPVFDEVSTFFGTSEIGRKVIRDLRKIYQPGRSLSEAFILFFRKYFPGVPLVFFNPADVEVKRMAHNFFQNAISRHDNIHEEIEKQTKELVRIQYSPQVELRPDVSHFFHVEDGERRRVDLSLIAKGINKEHSETLSVDVLLRPLLQDYLLPNIAYIGGPSEISYIAQLKGVYSLLEIPMPLIVPRWSGTIIERKALKFLKKINFDPVRIVEGNGKEILSEIIESASGKQFRGKFEKAYTQLRQRLDEIREIGKSLDISLVGMVDNSEQKMKYQLDKIEGRYQNALQAANKIAADRSARTMNTIVPGNKMQERTFSILNYLLRYGKDFPKFLAKAVSVQTDKHHILEY